MRKSFLQDDREEKNRDTKVRGPAPECGPAIRCALSHTLPPPNNLPASPHTQSTFLQHLATLPNNLLELVVAFEMPLKGALARKSFILPTIFALS